MHLIPQIRRLRFFWLAVVLLAVMLAACSSSDGSLTPEPETSDSNASGAVNGELDLSDLPNDTTKLMLATLEEPIDRVARKMAYSGNQAYIPVLLEFLRFQNQPENIPTMTSYLTRLKDNVPMEELLAFAPEQNEWSWWIEWLGNNPQVQPPYGYVGWKGYLYSLLEPGLGGFWYNGAKSDLRVEEIVWGGVPKNGIPDLIDSPVLSATDADYLLSDDRVFGVSINGEHRAYLLRIMNRHEMANDIVGSVPIALAY